MAPDSFRCFYDVSDGIFLNYTWTEKQLESSRLATKTPANVYVGIDVFGRGCFGGGGYNTSQALAVARRLVEFLSCYFPKNRLLGCVVICLILG